MTELPRLNGMAPDDWQQVVSELAERLEGEIQAALDDHTTPEEVKETLAPILEPYLVDSDGGTNPARLDVWTDDNRLCIGVPGVDYAPVVYDEDRGFWWYATEEPVDGVTSAAEAHRRVAGNAVCTTIWGNPDSADQMAYFAKRSRRIAAPYLERLEEALVAGDPTARDLREPLFELVDACQPHNGDRELRDDSPDAHRTHLTLLDRGEVSGHLLAVDPGRSLEQGDLEELFDIDDLRELDGAVVVTDHVRFREVAPHTCNSGQVRLPSTKDDDLAAYHRSCQLVTDVLDNLMKSSPISHTDKYLLLDDGGVDEEALDFEFTRQAFQRPNDETFYRPFLDCVEAWRRRRINSFPSEDYDAEQFISRTDEGSEDYLGKLRLYPEALRDEVGAVKGQFHYFFHKQPERTPPVLRVGFRVERPAHVGDNADGHLDYSWDVMAGWLRNAGMFAITWHALTDAGFRFVAGTVDGDRKVYDSQLELERFVRGESDDDETYFLEVERVITWDELAAWSASEDDGEDHLDTLVERMRRAHPELVPAAESTARLLAVINEMHPMMRSFFIAM